MQVNPGNSQPEGSFTNRARREQIIQTAIEVLAEHGYAGTSFARIREQAGLSSTRLISYHFAGKQDLMASTMQYVIEQAGTYMGPQIQSVSSLRDKLAVYIRTNLQFLAERPAATRALLEILSQSNEDWLSTSNATRAEDLLISLFRQGQTTGEFCAFDAASMAFTVRAAIDATVNRTTHEPDLDLAFHAEELVGIFERATCAKGDQA